MRNFLIILAVLATTHLAASPTAAENPGPEKRHEVEFTDAAVERGKGVFMTNCNLCHGLKYYRDKEHMEGISPLLDPKSAAESFGTVPPDLSLMAQARGKRLEGAEYIHRLLTTYYEKDGRTLNRAFAEETQSEGAIAMPQPIASTDPELGRKAADVAAFLFTVAEPTRDERLHLGRYVLIYMVILTGLLYALNKATWRGVKKKK